MKNREIREEVDETLRLLDQIKRQKGNPFLHTRVMEQIKRENAAIIQPSDTPVWKLATIALLLVMNVFVLIQLSDHDQSSSLDTLSEEYGLHEYGSSSKYSNF